MKATHQNKEIRNDFDFLNDVKMDFSDYEIMNLSETERNKMKNINKPHKKFSVGKVSALAACVALVVVFSQTAIAKDFFGNIISSVSTGHNLFVKTDDSNMKMTLPDEVKGKFYDKDGNPATEYRSGDTLFDAEGNEILDVPRYITETLGIDTLTMNGAKVKVQVKASDKDVLKEAEEAGENVVYELDKINDSLNFTAKLPDYVPENFEFFGATADGDYLFLYYRNKETGNYFAIHERAINDETTFETSTDGTLIETTVNGSKAVLMEGKTLDWETDGIAVSVMGRNTMSTADVYKVADSIK